MESRNEIVTRKILELVDSLSRFQEALAIEDSRNRDQKTLEKATSLINDIETSYDYLVGIAGERAHELVNALNPLSTHSRINKSITSILRCIERSSGVLRQITREDETVYRLDRLYKEFRNSTNLLANRNFDRVHSYLETANLGFLTTSLLNEVIGNLLEFFYVPKLVKNMGYQLKSKTVPTSIGDIQVDVRAEKDEIIGFEDLEKHQKREVLIVEVKTTVRYEDITKLSRKNKAILDNYLKESKIWKYRFTSATWMVACYGWNDKLKEYARNQGIKPIDGEELQSMLRKYNLLYRSRPPCPKQPEQ